MRKEGNIKDISKSFILQSQVLIYSTKKCVWQEARRVKCSMDRYRKWIGTILLVSLIVIGFIPSVQQYVKIPTNITLFENQTLPIQSAQQVSSNQPNVSVEPEKESSTWQVSGNNAGESKLVVQAGAFPAKEVDVKVLPDFKVYPGGQSIGVKLNSKGVLVVGYHQVDTKEGKKSPGEIAGIQVGDMITEINGKNIEKMSDVTPFIKQAGKSGDPLNITVTRDDQSIKTKLYPLKDKGDYAYRIGLYIRDSAAGIGTMTFFEPNSKKYGALGHVISDMDTKKPIVVKDGQIMKSTVTSIEKGSDGAPGEKLARFSSERSVIGDITRNSPFGIYGKLTEQVENNIVNKPLPIALSHQVKKGPAKILTVIEENKVEEFSVEIVSTVDQKFPATKGMVIKVTDPKLLEKTGGIVQGMSGSPIIQDGRLVGAVTHVFVNDSTSGYGVHIEWMLNEAGIDIYEHPRQKAS